MEIRLKYIGGLIEDEVLDDLEKTLSDHSITLNKYDTSGVLMASAEELIAPIALMLTSEVTQAYVLGLTTNAFYDIIKTTVLTIWNQITGKKYTKYNHIKSEEIEATFDLDVRTPGKVKVQFKLKGDVPDHLKEKCIDKAFEIIDRNELPENRFGYISRFNQDNESWEVYDQMDYVRKFIIKR